MLLITYQHHLKKITNRSFPGPQKPKKNFRAFLIVVLSLTLLVFMSRKVGDFFEKNDSGEWIPKEGVVEKQQELANDFREKVSNDCEQYRIVAIQPGLYPCYNCIDNVNIFLKAGFTWKIGHSCEGEDRMNKNNDFLNDPRLQYNSEYKGDLTTAVALEKEKIMMWMFSPENKNNNPPLLYPPGNKRFK